MSTTGKKTILFVDDDPVALQFIQDKFRKVFANSVSYERADSAEEAEEVILEQIALNGRMPAIIVCDWMMPGKRGDQFLKEIRKIYPEIHLVLHSGMATNDQVAQIDAKADLLCALPKPWDGKLYVDRLFQALQKAS